MAALLAASVWGFGAVRQNFFPSSNTPIFFVDLWLPYGTDIKWTEKMTSDIEKTLTASRAWKPPSQPLVRAVCGLF
jgi:multidrug efflux pump subunit AcrB